MIVVVRVDFSTREDTRTKVLQYLNTVVKPQSILQTLFLSVLMPGVLIHDGEHGFGDRFLDFLGSGPPFVGFEVTEGSKVLFHC